MTTNVNANEFNAGSPVENDVLETAGLLGLSPDEAAGMSLSEVGSALNALKSQAEDQNVNSALLTDVARIA